MSMLRTLNDYLDHSAADAAVVEAIRAIADACVRIRQVVESGAVGGHLGASGSTNVQDEEQKKLDVISNDLLSAALRGCQSVAGFASEELEHAEPTGRQGGVLVTFDPLDGSSNIDVNVSVGTIFSILPAPAGRTSTEEDFLRPGREQLAAGYAVYGPQTTVVLTLSDSVAAFTLAQGEWILTDDRLAVTEQTQEFAINMSNQRHWAEPVRAYIAACLAGREGPRGKDFNMRWVGSMVADVHRILTRGGVFLYPWDAREPTRPGKLRLLYEGAPMALLIERAGGAATDGQRRILDITPTRLHERVSVILGSRDEVFRLGTGPDATATAS